MAAAGISQLLILSAGIGRAILYEPFLLTLVSFFTAVVADRLAVYDSTEIFVRLAAVTDFVHSFPSL